MSLTPCFYQDSLFVLSLGGQVTSVTRVYKYRCPIIWVFLNIESFITPCPDTIIAFGNYIVLKGYLTLGWSIIGFVPYGPKRNVPTKHWLAYLPSTSHKTTKLTLMKTTLILVGQLRFLLSPTGLHLNTTRKGCICEYTFCFMNTFSFSLIQAIIFANSYSLYCQHYSLRVSAVLDHFGYPAPSLNQWQQRIWYDLGATQELLHQMRNRLARGLPAVTSPARPASPLTTEPAAALTLPGKGKFIKASSVESAASGTASAGPSSTAITSLTTEKKKKKRRKQKSTKCTVTSETIPLPAKRRKVVPESPDSQAEGPFYDSDHTESTQEDPTHSA